MKILAMIMVSAATAAAQEAGSGFDLRGTVSAQAAISRELEASPRNGGAFAPGLRAVLYPTWKINAHWSVAGAVQLYTEPYFPDEFSSRGYKLKKDVLQLHLTYARYWNQASIMIRAGQLAPSFGSFQSRYDDMANPLIASPWSYGYYGRGVTLSGLPSAEVAGTFRRLDGRIQLANSSPANPRRLWEGNQYGSWVGGAGYTLMQGFRIGGSFYRGAYLSQDSAYYSPREEPLRGVPATALGLEAQWASGHWSTTGEIQHFRFNYRSFPDFLSHTGYVEARRTLSPRWSVATRVSYVRQSFFGRLQSYEVTAGYRPNRFQLLKFGYAVEQGAGSAAVAPGRFQVQYVTQFKGLSISRD